MQPTESLGIPTINEGIAESIEIKIANTGRESRARGSRTQGRSCPITISAGVKVNAQGKARYRRRSRLGEGVLFDLGEDYVVILVLLVALVLVALILHFAAVPDEGKHQLFDI